MSCDETINHWARRPIGLMPWWTASLLQDTLNDARRLEDCRFEVFAQGSWPNGTNIETSSDVDLVVMMTLPFQEEVKRLSSSERRDFYTRYEPTYYGWPEFRADVLATLRERFFVHEGRKCIDIRDWDSALRIPADILPAVEYRSYGEFALRGEERFTSGVLFRDSSGHEIVNYPKQHLANGKRKDRATGGRFKQVVRAVKNARLHAHEGGPSRPAGAPSYFVECLLYRVPDQQYRTSIPAAYRSCLEWLVARADQEMEEWKCQNDIVPLFGEGSDRWAVKDARQLLAALTAVCP